MEEKISYINNPIMGLTTSLVVAKQKIEIFNSIIIDNKIKESIKNNGVLENNFYSLEVFNGIQGIQKLILTPENKVLLHFTSINVIGAQVSRIDSTTELEDGEPIGIQDDGWVFLFSEYIEISNEEANFLKRMMPTMPNQVGAPTYEETMYAMDLMLGDVSQEVK